MKNKLEHLEIVVYIDEDPDLSYLDQFKNSEDPEEQKYYLADQRRKEQYYSNQWTMYGIVAKGSIKIPISDNCGIIQFIDSPGLWGVQSDSEPSYLMEVAREELTQLKTLMEAMNTDTSEWIKHRNKALEEAAI